MYINPIIKTHMCIRVLEDGEREYPTHFRCVSEVDHVHELQLTRAAAQAEIERLHEIDRRKTHEINVLTLENRQQAAAIAKRDCQIADLLEVVSGQD